MNMFIGGIIVGFYMFAFIYFIFCDLYDKMNKDNPMIWVRKDRVKED